MKIAVIAGIPVRLHWSFVVLGVGYLLYQLLFRGLVGVVELTLLLVVLFGSVLLHELGHALAARAFGIRTAHITLYPFGGVAAISQMPKEPWQELVISLAGPLVNFGLFGFFAGSWVLTGWWAAAIIAGINLVMGLFNLIPAFPMDGGRVLRALLATQLGWHRASELAIQVGRAFAWLFVLGGLVARQPSLMLVGGFLFIAIAGESRRLWAAERYRVAPPPRFAGDGLH